MKRSDLYKGTISWMARNPVAANLLMVALLFGGFVMSGRIREEVFPSMELDWITITVPYPGASPAEVEQGIVLAIEEAVRPLDGVKEVTGTAMESMGSVRVELEVGTNRNKALADVKNHVDRITTFPVDAEKPIVSMPEFKHEAIWLVVYGDLDESVLHELGEQARDELLAHPEISYVELDGVKPLEIAIEISRENLRRYGLTLPRVAQRVRSTALELPAGGIKTRGGEVLLRTAERRNLGSEFADIAAVTTPEGAAVTIGDIATIKDGYSEIDMTAMFEGQPCIIVKVFSVGDESPKDVAIAAKDVAASLREKMPEGVGVANWMDMADLYVQRLDLLLRNAAIGLSLVLLILGLFLEPRLAFWVTMGIPISFLGAFILLPAIDISLNMISLFAFIVTLGMVVDDAIVVGENAFRHRREGKSALRAAIEGAREVSVPVFFSIATTVCAFSPLLFIPGTRGKFMMAIPAVVIVVLIISLVESFFILPSHLAHLGKPGKFIGFVVRYQGRFSDAVERFIAHRYAPVVRLAVRHRSITLALGIAMLLSSCGLIQGGQVKFIDFPKEESDWIFVNMGLQFGVAAEETEAIVDRLVDGANAVIEENGGQEISKGIFSVLGSASTTRGNSQGSHLGMVGVMLVPTDQRPISSTEFAEAWREKAGDIAGLEFIRFDSTTGRSETPPIDIRLSHRDPAVLEDAAKALSEELRTFAGLKDIDDGIELGKPQLDFTLSDEGTRAGLTSADLASQVRSSYYGSEALRQQRGRNEIKVFVRLPRQERESLASVEELIVQTPGGGEMMLREAAHVAHGRAYTAINRVNGKRVLRVQADVHKDEANAEEVMQALYKETLPKLGGLFPGLTWERAGRQKSQKDFMDFLMIAFVFALIGIYGLIAVPLKSVMQPLFVVMMAIPFGFVGAVLGHWGMGVDWSMISWMGLVALSGVVVNDSLVLVDAANRIRGKKMPPVFAAEKVVLDQIAFTKGQLDEFLRAGGLRREGGRETRAAFVEQLRGLKAERKLHNTRKVEARVGVAVAAAQQRFRPILLTSLTTFGGLAPMIFETSVQARILIPMAVSLGFGVLFSTVIILVLVPSLYVMVEGARDIWRLWREGKVEGDEEHQALGEVA